MCMRRTVVQGGGTQAAVQSAVMAQRYGSAMSGSGGFSGFRSQFGFGRQTGQAQGSNGNNRATGANGGVTGSKGSARLLGQTVQVA